MIIVKALTLIISELMYLPDNFADGLSIGFVLGFNFQLLIGNDLYFFKLIDIGSHCLYSFVRIFKFKALIKIFEFLV